MYDIRHDSDFWSHQDPNMNVGSITSSFASISMSANDEEIDSISKLSALSSSISSAESSFNDYHIRPQQPDQEKWKEIFDNNAGRCYYINPITQQRQWSRPSSFRIDKDTRDIAIGVKSFDARKLIESKPSKLSIYVDDELFFRPIAPAPIIKTISMRQMKINRIRELSTELIHFPPATDFTTVSKIETIGSSIKSGYLWKRSKYLGRWIKRYFILDNRRIRYYSHEKARNGKEIFITSETIVYYLPQMDTIAIKGLRKNDVLYEPWILRADEDELIDEWVHDINCHVHMQFKIENNIHSDYLDEGEIATSFWKLIEFDAHSRPFEIRTLPFINGPVTNELVYPGETVEVVQTINQSDGVVFMRLAEDRGWVYNSKGNKVFDEVKGHYSEEMRTYFYPKTEEILTVFCGPCMSSDPVKDVILHPGTTFTTCSSWRPSIYDWNDESILYVKLTKEKVWVAIRSTSTVILVEASPSSAKSQRSSRKMNDFISVG